jgi:hypothetical protein
MQQAAFLGAAQNQLRRLITDPDGVEVALAASGDPDGARLGGLLRSDRALPAAERLAVYANAYFLRIRDCLREDFGALASVLGEAAFHDLVKTYLMAHPPSRPSLRHAGAQLAAHLRTEPFAAIFSQRCSYAADLADLEWAIVEAFYAPDAAAIGADAFAQLAPEDWADLRFELTPSLRTIACDWPVQRVREHFDEHANAPAQEGQPLAADPTQIRVWRRGERVLYRAIAPLDTAALEAAASGDSFGAICERVEAAVGDAEAPRIGVDLLASWLAAGLIVGRN